MPGRPAGNLAESVEHIGEKSVFGPAEVPKA